MESVTKSFPLIVNINAVDGYRCADLKKSVRRAAQQRADEACAWIDQVVADAESRGEILQDVAL